VSPFDLREPSIVDQNQLPSEVELVFEVMPCNALRVAQEPGKAPHPCSYFRKWGTYHSYDYETAEAPPQPSIVQLTQYLGRATLVPELLSGCRKAPLMAVGINPNLPGWWPATRNSINPLFDDYRQYAHYFRYRETAKLDIPRDQYDRFRAGADDSPLVGNDLPVPKDPQGFRTIPIALQPMAMYQNYGSLLNDLAKEMEWRDHRLSIGEDLSYGNMVACPSAKWINKRDPADPQMPPMSTTEQVGIVAECFHLRRYFLRQLFQSLPRVLLIFSQSTTDAFLGEMDGHITTANAKPGDQIEDLLQRVVRLEYGKAGDQTLSARVIFSPHITGDPAHFAAARARVLAQLVEEARLGNLAFNAETGHLHRPIGDCVFCTMLDVGPCDYLSELVSLQSHQKVPENRTADHLKEEKKAHVALMEQFLASDQPPARVAPLPFSRSREHLLREPALAGWTMAGDPTRQEV
jgi:hypothetical protein